ncbi:MAG: AMP-dependent synthetase [Aeromicrobium sp.]|uniref:AMP-binding protein n=1 Tax=Aeromicrobium sp. TaxID=1871063 RepID=UPI002622F5E8|nr:AMP-binding protein [Aeromicrobium sp.]MCW2824206.1 AMP-dependent synthetase [Aeromicrobium sp.]
MITERHAFAALARHGQRPALIGPDDVLTYADVAERVAAARDVLTTDKRLVVVAGTNSAESLIAYTSAMAHGHAVLLVPAGSSAHLASIVDAYDPDVVFDPATGDGFVERRAGTRHDLHPDLALLMSTSGSTGSAKLVRLSHDNVVSNARGIADYLDIAEDDRALTTLPMHYCYGLSVVNSHLLTGAGLVVTDWSVVDDCLWDLAASAEATSFAGVPYTFDLLDSIDFFERDLPSLRHITQAGGRLAPDRIAAYVDLGLQRGWRFFAMYGQTEATARMAYLPPELAQVRPEALGVPVPGGSFRLETVPELAGTGVGELVYAGPNVMMGYATTIGDLAAGPQLAELHTGDLARRHDDGSYELVGRRSRLAKVFGLRIDLDELERLLLDQGVSAWCVSVSDRLQVFVDWHTDAAQVRTVLARCCGLPEHVVTVGRLRDRPLTANGKTDYPSLERQARLLGRSSSRRRERPSAEGVRAEDIRDLYAELLARPDATPDDSFTSLRGDSLSYVELSVRLGELGVRLPSDWQRHRMRDLVTSSRVRPTWGVRLEMSVLLRAVAILLILGTHANVWTAPGGAHVLLAVVGYNFARFQLTDRSRVDRVRASAGSLVRLALPCIVWIGAVAVVAGTYRPQTALFLNGLTGSDQWTVQWQFWFLEAILWIQVAAVTLLAVPLLHRAERRAPFGFAKTVLVVALVLRFALTGVEAGPTERYTPSIVLWCFALGWALAQAHSGWQRLAVSATALVGVIGFFGDPEREAVVITGILLLAWVPAVRLPKWGARAAGVVAAASLYIYLTQWQIYPHLEDRIPLLAVATSIAGAMAYQLAWERGVSRCRRLFRRSGAAEGLAASRVYAPTA